MMSVVNGYRLAAPVSMADGGNSLWAIGFRDGAAFHVKRFLTPTYPAPAAPGSLVTKQLKSVRCLEFERDRISIQNVLARLIDTKNIIPVVDFFRWNAHYYQV